MVKNKTIGFAIVGIKTEEFASFEPSYDPKLNINLNTSIDFRLQVDARNLIVIATFVYEQENCPIIKAKVACSFHIQQSDWVNLAKENEIVFPKSFITHLSMITAGTSRGVIHTKLERTSLNQFLLPTIDITSMVKSDVKFVFK